MMLVTTAYFSLELSAKRFLRGQRLGGRPLSAPVPSHGS
jgi:hypothetical protein